MGKYEILCSMLVNALTTFRVTREDINAYMKIATARYGQNLESASYEELGRYVDSWAEDVRLRSM